MSNQTTKPIVIGTRGSALAMWQAEYITARLIERFPDRQFVIKPIRTRGDLVQSVAMAEIGTRGVFVKEIQAALLAGEVDFGVHSLKDLPSEDAEDLVLAAVGPRADPRDALISRHGVGLAALPQGARVGTSSPRRAAQVKALRPDCVILGLRGNVDTRVRKALDEQYDGIVLAAAGLHRLGLGEHIVEYLPVTVMVPASGQGIIAVEARAGDAEFLALAAAIDDSPTHHTADAERAFVRTLGGGCFTPLGVYATVSADTMHVVGLLASPEGDAVVRQSVDGPAGLAVALGERLARQVLAMGGEAILAAIPAEDR
ncbi:MAG: hydroxymethylbilane synthase [Chloroflexota bacterium]